MTQSLPPYNPQVNGNGNGAPQPAQPVQQTAPAQPQPSVIPAAPQMAPATPQTIDAGGWQPQTGQITPPATQPQPVHQPVTPQTPASPPTVPTTPGSWDYNPTPETPSQPSPAGAPDQGTFLGGVREALAREGVDTTQFADDQQALAHLAQIARERPQLEQYAHMGMQQAQQLQQYQQQPPAAQPQAPATPESDPLDEAWGAPEYDPNWEQYVEFDQESETYRPINPSVPYAWVDGVNKYHQFLRTKTRDFLSNPIKKTWQGIETQVDKRVEERVEAKLREVEDRNTVREFQKNNAGWLYEKGQNGEPVIAHQTGEPVYSPMGQQFRQRIDWLRNNGITEPKQLLFTALDQLRGDFAQLQLQQMQQRQAMQAQQAAQQLPAPAAQQPAYPVTPANAPAYPVAANEAVPPVNGLPTVYNPSPLPQQPSPEQASANRIGSFLGNAHAAFQTQGSVMPAAVGAPVVVRNQGDLDAMWESELNAHLGS